MSTKSLKTHYSAKELLELSLSCLPNSVQGIIYQAKKQGWKSQKRVARGGGSEFALASLPKEIQNEIYSKFTESIVQRKPTLPAVKQIDLDDVTSKQRDIADARMALVAYVQNLEQVQTRDSAIKFICNSAKSGQLPDEVMALVERANCKNGKNCGRVLSHRTLYGWILDYNKAKTPEERLKALVPSQRKADRVEDIAWLPDFLAIYRNTNGVSVAEAYAEFAHKWKEEFSGQPLRLAMLPSIDRVRRALSKLPRHIKEIGRKTGAEMRALQTYVKRDWSCLLANDVWVGDGHSMKMKVQHPDHGRPFIPELTMVMDAPSRFIVGWSVSLSENALAVADAIRHGVENHGIPAIYYSDNGGGEKNWMLDGDITGMLPRLGINHQTGIPGNPQGRGIIERVNQTIALKIARQFDTYHGTGADRDTVRKTSTAVISLDKAIRKGATELTEKQKWAKGKLPTWQQFIDAVQVEIDRYNNHHIHREIGTTPARKRRELLAKAEIIYITAVEARDLFRPSLLRVAQRGWINLFNNVYFSQKLLDVDGQQVQVSIDIHDPSSVIIRQKNGTYICEAMLDGNKRDAFPMSLVEKARKDRAQGRLKRKQEKVDEINAELNPVITIEQNKGAELLHGLCMNGLKKKEEVEEIAVFPSDLKRMKRA
ncbi:Mu transposase C-terminal domain-containing protein [Pasteurella multocida]|uniref:Mu transposase C-terminal domain-containing protein n=3 Tax=Pasteurella multocida TaxID=747 RepID=UPI000354318F|nr:Mu transposase C-terminal domain-containing protein [Pasteurella multocida]ESQ72747.1 transposase [Pasteurella multocida subsp. multocida P1062]MCL7842528.1 Mu transposase C-terminal domain-containing protein [Pasteurella multocida]MDY0618018.1 Mu transposase C-terminal domain-containing protein [Pasteurella multocida]WLY63747.1 Mu transposase C-terminal domain-containing protein [Pasteurella multocida]HEH9706103.1 transposase [Pasteurella multocida]